MKQMKLIYGKPLARDKNGLVRIDRTADPCSRFLSLLKMLYQGNIFLALQFEFTFAHLRILYVTCQKFFAVRSLIVPVQV